MYNGPKHFVSEHFSFCVAFSVKLILLVFVPCLRSKLSVSDVSMCLTPVRVPLGILYCVLGRDTLLSVSFSTWVYKWVLEI